MTHVRKLQGQRASHSKTVTPKRLRSKAVARKRSGQQFRRFLAWSVLSIGAFGALGGYAAVAFSERQVAIEVERVKEAGGIVSPSQIPDASAVPFEQNAAHSFAGAESLMQADRLAEISAGVTESSPDPHQLALSVATGVATVDQLRNGERKLHHISGALDTFRVASKFPYFAVPRDYEHSFEIGLPEPTSIRKGAGFLQLDAAFAARQGDWNRASEDLVTSARMAKLLRQDPPMWSQITASLIQRDIAETAEGLLCMHPLEPKATLLAEDTLKALGPTVTFREVVRANTLLAVQLRDTAQRQSRLKASSNQMSGIFQFMNVPGMGAAIQAKVLRFDRAELDLAAKFGNNHKALIRALEALQQAPENVGILPEIASNFAPNPLLEKGLAEVDAKRSLIRQALDIIKQRRQTGKWPGSLLTGEGAPIDPFTNGPFHFSRTSDAIKIWSVGADGKDSQGIHNLAENDQVRPKDDISMTLSISEIQHP